MSKQKKQKPIVVRPRLSYRTEPAAWRSMEKAGYAPCQVVRTCHTGTYWRWELDSLKPAFEVGS